MFGPQIASR